MCAELFHTQGDRVRWYLVALGNEVDVHAPHWHGNTGLVANNTQVMDQLNLLPINIQTFDMVRQPSLTIGQKGMGLPEFAAIVECAEV